MLMKKLRFFLILLSLTCSYAQAEKLFVEMEFYENCIKLDDGSNKNHQPIKGEDGKDLKFTSLIGAINYMSLQGWELVETRSVISGQGYVSTIIGGQSSTNTKVYYIFSKDVTEEELEQIVNNSYKTK